MTARLKLILILVLAACLLLGAAQAVRVAHASWTSSSPAIVRWVLSAGGGLSSGSGQITLNATLGQPVVGQSLNGSTVLKAGYWNAAAVSGNAVYLPVVRK